MKVCKICSETKALDQFKPNGKYLFPYCIPCNNERTRIYLKQYRKNNPGKQKSWSKKYDDKPSTKLKKSQYYEENKDGHYSVYLLPNHNYVGKTNCVEHRMSNHRSQHSRYTKNVRILYTTKCEAEALELEALLHDLGYEGRNATYTQRKSK
tara:strand:+ start:202 stop:657 length:456 start_codon:yes stop_codon:yes gene_type:complete